MTPRRALTRTGYVLALAVALHGAAAQADRRELYLELEAGLAVQWLADAPTAQSSATALGPELQLHVFYGITNALHVGGYARGVFAPDAAFPHTTPALEDGSTPTGTVYANLLGAGAGVLGRWRFDTGYAFAPFLQLELGVAWTRFLAQQLIPDGKDFGIDLPTADVLGLDARALAGVEYRLGDRFLVALHLGGRHVFSRVGQWQLDVGLAGGILF